jgi:plastocyanin
MKGRLFDGVIVRMLPSKTLLTCVALLSLSTHLSAGPDTGTLAGIVTFKGAPPKRTPFDLAKDPACAKLHAADPLLDELIVTGRGNGLANVVVYISAGESDAASNPPSPVFFKQRGCRYAPRVLPVSVGQEVKIVNIDPVPHDIHPVAKVNRDWSRIQPPQTPPFAYSYDKPEIIPVKCNIHPWMQGYLVVLKTTHFAVTGEDGVFRLPDLPPGKYTVTAWHESLGTKSQEITVTPGATTSLYLTFSPKS